MAAATQTFDSAVVDDEVAARLRTVIARLSRRLKPTAAAGALTTTDVDVMAIVARDREAPVKLSELAVQAGLNPTMLSRMVGKLEAQGLLRRLGDESDGRVWRVELTPSGRRLQEKVRKERARRLAHELHSMSPEERQTVVAALAALEELAERLLDK
ncbi:MAG: MarR family winged helix-turn-helix transcriptional regulator [Acidimicrobiales bacterium]